MSEYYSKSFTQSTYRNSSRKKSDAHPPRDLNVELPNISAYSPTLIVGIRAKIKTLNALVFKALLNDLDLGPKATVYLDKIIAEMTTKTKPSTKSADIKTKDKLWQTLRLPTLSRIKLAILTQYTPQIIDVFTKKISYLVNRYARHLPHHVASSERDDLLTISRLELIETIKSWDPEKNADVWPLAYMRINGAMKDHIRYITKSDPGRFYDWVTDVAYMMTLHQQESTDQTRIENNMQLAQLMKVLSDRDRLVVLSYTQKDLTFAQISEHLKISESQVSRIYKKAIEKLKKSAIKHS